MELVRALGALSELPSAEHERLATVLALPEPPTAAEHSDVFLFQLYPYASVYLGAEGMLGGEARDRVAGFWRALGLVPPAEPDHLGALLGLYASLAESERSEGDPARARLLREARRALLWEHLLSWLPPYLVRMREIAPSFYLAWAELLERTLAEEALALGAGERAPLHHRAAPALPDPREDGLEPFLAGLLAPARSGLLLLRSDLARAASSLGLGLRAGERAFALRALLGQDAPGMLGWLAAEAGEWGRRHGESAGRFGPVTGFWVERAKASAALLVDLAEEAAEREERSPMERKSVPA